VNPNPAAIIGYALRDLLVILNEHKGKGGYMFFLLQQNQKNLV